MNDVEILENLIEDFRKAEFSKLDYIEDLYQRFNYKDYKAIENILKERQEDKERIKELEKYEKYYQNERNLLDSYISKSKVRKKIEELEKNLEKNEYDYDEIFEMKHTIKVLQGLLEEGE